MADHSFTLIPFPGPNIPEIQITGTISRENNVLNVHCSLTGNTEDIWFPERSANFMRKNDLWKTTCFEFFLAIPGQPQYWEFNVSPSGGWNIYRMDAYRAIGFREETALQNLPFSMYSNKAELGVDVVVDLMPIIPAQEAIEVGISGIVQTKGGHASYWALLHPNHQADFHVRESFLIKL